VLDELDAVEVPPGHESFADDLRDRDLVRKGAWQAATHTWAVDALQFSRRAEGDPDGGVWRYQFRLRAGSGGRATLMPVGRLLRHFRHILDTESELSTPDAPLTYPLTFERGRAQRRQVSLARIGDPFVDALVEYVGWDDRGAVAAMWRYRPRAMYARPAELAFRFVFVLECPTAEAVAELPAHGNRSLVAIRRQADWLFPPFALSVWLDGHLEPIADPTRLAALEEEYSKKPRPDRGQDFNLNPDRWARLDFHFPRADWAAQVERARAAADRTIRASDAWRDAIAQRLKAARRTAADREAQATSRLAFLTGAPRREEEARAAVEKAVAEAMLRGIEGPSIRLDSAGAVILADWNPFEDRDE
jgi:ATP-dependent helicase HepA